eukprot:21592-Hanusia_phi.AAC.1
MTWRDRWRFCGTGRTRARERRRRFCCSDLLQEDEQGNSEDSQEGGGGGRGREVSRGEEGAREGDRWGSRKLEGWRKVTDLINSRVRREEETLAAGDVGPVLSLMNSWLEERERLKKEEGVLREQLIRELSIVERPRSGGEEEEEKRKEVEERRKEEERRRGKSNAELLGDLIRLLHLVEQERESELLWSRLELRRLSLSSSFPGPSQTPAGLELKKSSLIGEREISSVPSAPLLPEETPSKQLKGTETRTEEEGRRPPPAAAASPGGAGRGRAGRRMVFELEPSEAEKETAKQQLSASLSKEKLVGEEEIKSLDYLAGNFFLVLELAEDSPTISEEEAEKLPAVKSVLTVGEDAWSPSQAAATSGGGGGGGGRDWWSLIGLPGGKEEKGQGGGGGGREATESLTQVEVMQRMQRRIARSEVKLMDMQAELQQKEEELSVLRRGQEGAKGVEEAREEDKSESEERRRKLEDELRDVKAVLSVARQTAKQTASERDEARAAMKRAASE